MAQTEFGVNHALSNKVWSKKLMVQSIAKTVIAPYIGSDKNSLIYSLTDLQKNAGDVITYGLRMKLTGDGIQGDNTLEGQEENLTLYSDTITLNQLRHATRSKGKMSEQRVPYDVRQENMDGLSDWWAERFDVSFANQIAGNTVQSDTRYTGNNTVTGPSANNIMRPADVGTDEASISNTSTDKFTLTTIDNAVARAKTMDQLSTPQPIIRPVVIDSDSYYVCFVHPWQVRDMRTNTNTGQWLDIQKAVTSGGQQTKNAIFTGALGMYNNVIIKEWARLPNAIATAGTAVANTKRAVLCGAQSACLAYGQGDGRPNKMDWTEELFDYKNQLGVEAGAIWALKKTIFNALDFGTIVLPTYAAAS